MSPRAHAAPRGLADWATWQISASFALIAVVGLAALFVESEYYLQIMVLTTLYAAVGVSWTIAGGFGGLLLLGYISFYGLGAYVNGVLYTKYGISPWLCLLIAPLPAALLALAIAAVTLRFGLSEDYFAMFTVALSQVLKYILLNWDFVGRATGIYITVVETNVLTMSFVERRPYLYIALALLAIALAISYAVQRSRLGYYLAAVRENSQAAEALGINTARIKTTAIVISGAMAGTLGAFYCQFATFIDPRQVFSLATNFEMLLGPVLGGRLSVIGPVIGAVSIKPLQDLLRGWLGGQADAYYLVIYGFVLVAGILLLPKGIASYIEAWHRRRYRNAG
jgi:branched-chain amino acid transport system permease protein